MMTLLLLLAGGDHTYSCAGCGGMVSGRGKEKGEEKKTSNAYACPPRRWWRAVRVIPDTVVTDQCQEPIILRPSGERRNS